MTAALVALSLLSGCSTEEATTEIPVEEKFREAMELFENEDYLEAIEAFKFITLQYQGSSLSDDAQFYLGECHFMREEYVIAAYEYEVLIRTNPTSEFVPQARFKRGLSYYRLSPPSRLDQQYTFKAIDEFQGFLEYHPTDPRAEEAEKYINELNTRLAKKEYENGIIYMKMDYYRAATISFDFVLEKYHDTEYAEPALLKKAEALYYRYMLIEAQRELRKFLQRYPQSPLRAEAENLKTSIEENM